MNVFKSELIENAELCGNWDIPLVRSANQFPETLMSFSNRHLQPKGRTWMHFFIDDSKFESIWKTPERYISLFQKMEGVIGPDFSLYRNMPLAMQLWSTYKNRAISAWLVGEGIKVIPCVRWGNTKSFDFCFDGIEKNSVIAIGNHGCYSERYDRAKFHEGLCRMLDTLSPSGIVLYGSTSREIEKECSKKGTNLKLFRSDFDIARKEGIA